mgnify:CR=1 FL=1
MVTPGSAQAVWVWGSTSRRVIRVKATTMDPSSGTAPPERPLPAPRGTSTTPCRRARRTKAATSSRLSGRTTAKGSGPTRMAS